MSEDFKRVKGFLNDLQMKVVREYEDEEMFLVADEENGITNLVVDCERPILVLEQLVMEVPASAGTDFFRRLLQMNRSLVHGAFVIDEQGRFVFYRDTLQIENLDLNELQGTLGALSLALAENAGELLDFAHS